MSINVFISYPEVYEAGANALARSFNRAGINFYSFLHTPSLPGTDFPTNICFHIEAAHFIVLLWGAESSTDWVNFETQYAQNFGKLIIPVLVDNSALPYSLQRNQAILAFRDPSGWVLQVNDAIISTVNYINCQQQISNQNQQQVQQEKQRLQQEKERENFFSNLVSGVVGIGVLLAIAAAVSDDKN